MVHHSLEESLPDTCPRCGKQHDAKLFSLFLGEMHYIVGECDNCGYDIEFRCDELGGGLFMPDGESVTERFRKANVEHMKQRIRDFAPRTSVQPSFSTIRMRFTE